MQTKRFRRGDRLKVNIERLSIGGRGVARAESLVVFIPSVAPGEEVEVELTAVKKNFAEARLVRILKPSAMRITPPCPVAEDCGGCNWQHLNYDEQLRQKHLLVAEALRKFSGFKISQEQIAPVVPSPSPLRYRNRVQLHHSGPRLGFFKRSSHEIVDIDDCLITEWVLASEIPRLKMELAHKKAGRVEIYLSEDGKPHLRSDPSDQEDAEPAGAAFSQVNTAQNEKLVAAVIGIFKEALPAGGIERIYDFYAGSGNFSFPLANTFRETPVKAVELSGESVSRAMETLRRSTLTNLSFTRSDVAEFLATEPPTETDAVLLDPPRTGCAPEVVRLLGEKKPAHVVYVSCHPVTLARDLRGLHESGYELRSVRPFDMFPQTDHVETVAHLAKVLLKAKT